MRKIITYTAAGLMIATALPAYASSDDVSCAPLAGGQQLSTQDITAKVTEMGYDVRKVELDDGCFEVHVINKNGARLELKMHPVTGQVVKSESKS